jgi:acetoacetate decarboxylase
LEPDEVSKNRMPLTSPSFARGPYRCANREYLGVTYRTSRAALEAAESLTSDEPLARVEFKRTESSTGFGCYWGAAQYIPVKLNGNPGACTHNI